LAAFADARRGFRQGQRTGFPAFKKKSRTLHCFRVRSQRGSIKIGAAGQPRVLTVPKIGSIAVQEDTRRLRRMLRPGPDGVPPQAVITAVTVRQHRGRWIASVAVRAADLHPAVRHPPRTGDSSGDWVGIDRGLIDLVVAAADDGREVARERAPKTLQRRAAGLRIRQQKLARKRPGSKRRTRAVTTVRNYQERTAAIRDHLLHQVTNQLVKSHDRLVIENLHVAGMLANRRLAKALADASFGTLARMLSYKAAWYGAILVEADRWYPSSKICSGCGLRRQKLPLRERVFQCTKCGLHIDRDLNAAINLARQGVKILECLGRGQAPDPGPASGGPGDQRATQAPDRHRHNTGAAATGPSTARTRTAA
jgi:putative transposase